MAGFKTHIGTSTVLGIAYGSAAYVWYGVPVPTCLLAGGLCSVSGMLPDLDSGPGVPLRESVAFAAAVVPMLLIHRLQEMNMSPEMMVVIGAGVYLAIRFGLGRLLKSYTVHRGMFHSLPAAAIAGELGFLLASNHDVRLRMFKASAVVLGFMSHLILDEIWSIEFKYGVPTFKKSFGTAIKLFGDSLWGNISCWGKLVLLTWVVFNDPTAVRKLAAEVIDENDAPIEREVQGAEEREPSGGFFGNRSDVADGPTDDRFR